jgi:hypothetical protein
MSSKDLLHRQITRRNPEINFLIAADVPQQHGRLTLSSGIQLATQATTGWNYIVDAYIPKAPRLPASCEDVLELQPSRSCARSQTVGIMQVSAPLLKRLRIAAAESVEPSDLDTYIDEICAQLPPPWKVRTAPKCLTVGRNLAGLHTVTRDPITDQYVGLHVDTFDQPYDQARTQAGNRISVNIGIDARFFLFVPLSFRSLSIHGQYFPSTDIVREFLRSHPTQPVIAVRIEPGEAYIAPTESMIHDASSLQMQSEDVHITGRGVFEPGQP